MFGPKCTRPLFIKNNLLCDSAIGSPIQLYWPSLINLQLKRFRVVPNSNLTEFYPCPLIMYIYIRKHFETLTSRCQSLEPNIFVSFPSSRVQAPGEESRPRIKLWIDLAGCCRFTWANYKLFNNCL